MHGAALCDRNNMIRVLELFAGIGACSKALTRLGIDHTIVDAVEIDKYAIQAFNAIHGTNFEPQDIRTWDKDIECDLIMHGSPCQDFSIAGRQAGGDEGSGTRSSLMYETLRIVDKLHPKYVIWENVKNLLSKKHRHNFDAYIESMKQLGYVSSFQVLNAKDYGIPQNRERVFTVSIREDVWDKEHDNFNEFVFPKPIKLRRKLKDMLENDVDEKYYISENMMNYFMGVNQKPSKFPRKERFLANINRKEQDRANSITTAPGQRPTDNFIIEDFYKNREPRKYYGVSPTLRSERTGLKVAEPFVIASRGRGKNNEQQLEPRRDDLANTITSVQKDNYVAIKTANKQGYDMATDGDGVDLAYPDSKTRRGRVGHGVAKTLPTSDSQGVLDGFRIRKLTPKECWRLMGFDDEDFDKAKSAGLSNTQLYKQAGNSIVVNVLEAILTNLLEEKQ